MCRGCEGNSRAKNKRVTITVMWVGDATQDEFICKEPHTIQQHYKQLNFIDVNGEAVAINLHQTKFVKIDDDEIDFNDILQP